MTQALDTNDLSRQLIAQFGDGISAFTEYIEVTPLQFDKVACYLKNTQGLEFDFLDMVTAADYPAHFELIYRFLSLKNNTSVSLKIKCEKDKPLVPSVSGLWQGAVLQEREIYDLFGITFSGHPDLKRIVLWEGYEGFPLRKDFKDKEYGAGN